MNLDLVRDLHMSLDLAPILGDTLSIQGKIEHALHKDDHEQAIALALIGINALRSRQETA